MSSAQRTPITIRIDHFEGPLDLLLYLIQSHELDISRVSISKITDQYLGLVRVMQELSIDVASEFLVMAATLIQWKSKALLPADPSLAQAASTEDDVITEEELLRRLREHQLFLQTGDDLAQVPLLGDTIFTRANRRPPVEKVWKEMNVTQLALTLQDILTRARKRSRVLRKETVSITDKIVEFGAKLELGHHTALSSLVSALKTKPEVVVTFLASLELSRLKKLRVHQERTFDEIYLELLERIRSEDLALASGFDNAVAQAEAQLQSDHAAAAAEAAHAQNAAVIPEALPPLPIPAPIVDLGHAELGSSP